MDSTDNANCSEFTELGAAFSSPGGNPEKADPLVRRQAAVLAFGRRTNAQPSLSVLMQDAVALVAEILHADFSAIGEVVDDGAALLLKATAEQSGSPDPPTHKCPLEAADSMAAFALNSASPVVSADLTTEERFKDLFLRKLGARSAITVPLHVGGKAFGTLGVYATEKEAFVSEDVGFAETIAYLLSSSIARIKTENELKKQRTFSSTVLDIVDALVVAVDVAGNLLSINRACQQTTQFSVAEVRGKPFWNVFVVPKELELVRGIFRSAKTDNGSCEFESLLLTKDGTPRRICWSLKVMRDSHERPQSFVMTGIDRTEQVATEEELRKARTVAERATKALEEFRAKAGETERQARGSEPAGRLQTGEDNKMPRPFQPLGDAKGKETRTSQRRAYQYRQMIAPTVGGVIPAKDNFFPIECKDISAGGVSFLLDI